MPSARHHQGPDAAVQERARCQGREWARGVRSTMADGCVQVKARGFLATGAMIVKKESPLGLYKGV